MTTIEAIMFIWLTVLTILFFTHNHKDDDE
jgi:hypothetical protein